MIYIYLSDYVISNFGLCFVLYMEVHYGGITGKNL